VEDLLQVAGMSRIDENRGLAIDDISITIVLIRILPKIGIKILLQLHPFDRSDPHPANKAGRGVSLFFNSTRRLLIDF
jgi:hypothetical protein